MIEMLQYTEGKKLTIFQDFQYLNGTANTLYVPSKFECDFLLLDIKNKVLYLQF